VCENTIYPERVASNRRDEDATPLGLKTILECAPKVVAALQPWADRHYPVGVNLSPPLAEPRRIAAELDALQTEVDALKRLQAETAAELDALLPALLDRAFKGELR
jgi:type I restriction enzyme S subunit